MTALLARSPEPLFGGSRLAAILAAPLRPAGRARPRRAGSRGEARRRRAAAGCPLPAARRTTRRVEDVFADHVLDADRGVGIADLPTRLDHLVGGTRQQGQILVAEKPAGDDGGHRIRRQLHRRIDAQGEDRLIGLGIERCGDDAADLDAADAYVAAFAHAVDLGEFRRDLVAAHRMHLRGAVGEDEKERGDDEHDRAHHGLDDVTAHSRRSPLGPIPFALLRAPRLVIPGRFGAVYAPQNRARWPVCDGRAAQIRHMLLLPGIMRPLARPRRRVDRVVQPGVPLRRHARGLDLAVIEPPAPLAARHAAAPDESAPRLLAVIAIAELVGADQLALPPGEEPSPDAHCNPIDLELSRRQAPTSMAFAARTIGKGSLVRPDPEQDTSRVWRRRGRPCRSRATGW